MTRSQVADLNWKTENGKRKTESILRIPSSEFRPPNSCRGQSAAESAIGLLVLMLLVMGIFDLGRGIYAYSVISAAAQEGVRYGLIQPGNTNGIRNAVINNAIGLDVARMTVSVSQPEPNVVAVTVTHQLDLITPLITQAVGGNGEISLQVTAAMRQY